MMKANQSLRDKLKESGICYWQLAEYIGVHENTIVRWLRTPLSKEHEQLICYAMNAVRAAEKGGGGNATGV